MGTLFPFPAEELVSSTGSMLSAQKPRVEDTLNHGSMDQGKLEFKHNLFMANLGLETFVLGDFS
jgi:hypothetical protein